MVDLTHAPAAERLRERLRPWANQIAGRFGRPVYLVGSALRLPDPRDVDVRVVVSDEEFAARYGDPAAWSEALWWPSKHDGSLRYGADMADLAREASLVLRLNIDFQVQPPCEARRHMAGEDRRVDLEGRRRRLDEVPGLEDVVLISGVPAPSAPRSSPKLTRQQAEELRDLAQRPQPTFGKWRARVQNRLVELGLAHFADEGAPDVSVERGDVCAITAAGRAHPEVKRP